MFGRRVLFLLIVFTANLKANSSAPIGPDSTHSKIPPGGEGEKEKKERKEKQKTLVSQNGIKEQFHYYFGKNSSGLYIGYRYS